MIEFDDLEDVEETRNAEEQEQQRRLEEAAFLAKVLELEAGVEERVRMREQEPTEGTHGTLIVIPLRDFEYLKKWKEVTDIFFCDAMNASLQKLRKLFANRDRCIEVGIELYEPLFDIVFAFLNVAVQLRFHDGAVAVCESLADCFQAERGCCALVSQIMDAGTSERRRNDAKKLLHSTAEKIVSLLLRLVMCAHFQGWEHRDITAHVYCELFLSCVQGARQPFCLPVWLEHGWEVKREDVLEVPIRLEGGEEERILHASRNWQLRDLDSLAKMVIGPQVQVLQLKEGSEEPVEADLTCQFREVRLPVSLRGVDPEHPAWKALDLSTWPPEWAVRWRTFTNRVCKTTPVSATQLLAELRASFTSKKFQEKYRELKKHSRPGNKAHQEILAMTFSVQGEVLPRYGFEATPKGLMEMRDEMPLFAGLDIWTFQPFNVDGAGDEVVWKVRRDIHAVLDMGQVLPRMQLSGHESFGHKSWLRWAQLNAGVEPGCKRAGELIAEADILVLCAGAGFSADSGLAVYADVAKVGAYARRGLDYSDICNQTWLRKEPEFFWGFWGQCYNDYRDTGPHEGYRVIHRWVEKRFRNSTVASEVREKVVEHEGSDKGRASASNMPPPEKQPYLVRGQHAGAFYAFTSNVDAHLWDWFQACEIRECHGNIETFQCASLDGRCEGHWRAPLDYRFRVNKGEMVAPKGPAHAAFDDDNSDEDAGESSAAPRVGRVKGGGRPDALRHMPEAASLAHAGFRSNHPTCPFCRAPARPSILMFKDSDFRDNRPQAARWEAWVAAVKELLQSRQGEAPLRAVVLEIGAGGNVTTVRKTSETLVLGFLTAGSDAHLVRINPELPLGDGEHFAPGGALESRVVSIMSCALDSLRKIDAAIPC